MLIVIEISFVQLMMGHVLPSVLMRTSAQRVNTAMVDSVNFPATVVLTALKAVSVTSISVKAFVFMVGFLLQLFPLFQNLPFGPPKSNICFGN